MGFLSDIQTYWSGNSTLTSAVPYARVYTGLMPSAIYTYPYVVIVPSSSSPTFTTGTPYIEAYSFQFSVYSTSLTQVESICDTITGQFDFKDIAAGTISCIRTNGPFAIVDPDSPKAVYHGVIVYQFTKNRTLPT